MQWAIPTDVLAWWGAILSTVLLLWDIVKWRKEGVRLSVTVKALDVPEGKGIQCDIHNRGGKATTITEAGLVTYQDNWFLRLIRMPKSGTFLRPSEPEMKLPYLLAPGATWSFTYFFSDDKHPKVSDDDYPELIEQGRLYYKVKFSHSDRPIRGRVRGESLADFWG